MEKTCENCSNSVAGKFDVWCGCHSKFVEDEDVCDKHIPYITPPVAPPANEWRGPFHDSKEE